MKKALLILAAAALLAASCSKPEEKFTVSGDGSPVKFTAELKYQFDTKVSANAFGQNDEIGIFAGTPIARYNVKGTVGSNGTDVTLASPINWQAGQTSATTFAAYYPYNADKTPAQNSATPMVIDWAVAADQSQLPEGNSSDLLIAKAADVAVNAAVSLPFVHAFAKINVNVDNTSSLEVQMVEVLGTKVAGAVDLVAQTVTASGDATAIKTLHASSSSPYEAIIIPQTVAPQIRVTVAGGTTYTYTMDGSAIAFESGKVYNCTVAITPGQSQQNAVSFSVGSITGWTNGTGLGFSTAPVVESGQVWSVIGEVNGKTDWSVDFPMTHTATGENPQDGTWEIDITVAAGPDGNGNGGSEFKIRWAGQWGDATQPVAIGMNPGWWYADGKGDNNEGLQLWQANAKNIKCKEAGSYHITLFVPSCKAYVEKQ